MNNGDFIKYSDFYGFFTQIGKKRPTESALIRTFSHIGLYLYLSFMKNPKGKPTLAHSEDSNPKWVDVQKGMVPKVIVTLNFTRHNQDYQYPFYLLTDSENKTIEAALTLTHMLKENWGGNRKNGKVLAELTLESFLSGTKKERAELYDLTDANVVKLVKNLYKLVIGESVSI